MQKTILENPNQTKVNGSNSLADLAAQITVQHDACTKALKRGLQHAVAAGKLLIDAKSQLKHGEWLPWLRDHCHIPQRTARRYMDIAPYATDEIGQLADLTTDAAEAGTFEDHPEGWIYHVLNGPFTEDDLFDQSWFATKLFHQVQMPMLVSLALANHGDHDIPLLRLCGWDDLVSGHKTLVPIASGECVVKIDAANIKEYWNAIGVITVTAECLLGGLLKEIDRRCARGYTEEQYQREWSVTHAAWMAWLEAQRAGFESRREAMAAVSK
jgi:hypothetical protein